MIDKNLFRIDKIKPVLVGLAGCSILQAFLIIVQAYSLSSAITAVWSGDPYKDQSFKLIIFLISFVLRQVIHYGRDHFLDQYAYQQSSLLRKQLLAKTFSLGPQMVQRQGTGHMVTMTIEGISQIENYLTIILPKLTNMMIIPWLICFFIFTQHVQSAVTLLIVFPIIILFMIILGYAARAKADRQYEGFQRLSNHFIDTLRGLETLRYLGLSQCYAKRVYQMSEKYRKATMSTLKIAILSTFALDFFATLSIAVVAVFLGFALMEGHLLLFPALVILVLAPDFFLPIRDFSSDYHATLNGGNTLSALFTILDMPEFASGQPLLLEEPWCDNDCLAFSSVSVSYSNETDQHALEQVNFACCGYQKIGIVGLSGSGKSTLIKLLGGFIEPIVGSKIMLNECQVSHLKHRSWQDQLIYVPQDPHLFSLSLRDNIAFYAPESSEEDVLYAVQQAGLASLVAELPNGIDTLIGDGGQPLSGGQQQRIALARAFLDQSRHVLLFDEPTAHLDIETEAEIKERMLSLFDDHLVFFATHRLHWMKEMDQILVVEAGKIVEQGTYEELSTRDGAFKRLAHQMLGGNKQ